jgi:hypothetical protein
LDLQITVNGLPIDRLDLNRPVKRDEGKYEIAVGASGYEPFVATIELQNGTPETVVVTVPRLMPVARRRAIDGAPQSDASAFDGASPPGTQRTLAWVVGGTGAALGVAAGVFAVFAASKNEDSKAACAVNDPNRCGREGVGLRDDAKSLAGVATLAGVLGGVALAGGLVLYVTAASPDEAGVPQGALLTLQGSLF